jgi:hypothetical protein
VTYYAISGLIDAVVSSAAGLFVLHPQRGDIRHKTYGMFCLGLSVWGCFYFLWQLASDGQ